MLLFPPCFPKVFIYNCGMRRKRSLACLRLSLHAKRSKKLFLIVVSLVLAFFLGQVADAKPPAAGSGNSSTAETKCSALKSQDQKLYSCCLQDDDHFLTKSEEKACKKCYSLFQNDAPLLKRCLKEGGPGRERSQSQSSQAPQDEGSPPTGNPSETPPPPATSQCTPNSFQTSPSVNLGLTAGTGANQITTDRSGNGYFIRYSFGSSHIAIVSPDGAITRLPSSPPDSYFDSLGSPIASADDGSLYFFGGFNVYLPGDYRAQHGIYRLAPDGSVSMILSHPRVGYDYGIADIKIAGGYLYFLRGFSDESNQYHQEIRRIALPTTQVALDSTELLVTARQSEIDSFAVDSQGNIYLARANSDFTNIGIVKRTPSGEESRVMGAGGPTQPLPSSIGSQQDAFLIYLLGPIGLAMDACDNLLIADANQWRVYKLPPNATQATLVVNDSVAAGGQRRSPFSVAIDSNNNLLTLTGTYAGTRSPLYLLRFSPSP